MLGGRVGERPNAPSAEGVNPSSEKRATNYRAMVGLAAVIIWIGD